MNFDIRQEGDYRYVEVGEGHTILLLHGLFGALSNFNTVINAFSSEYKVIIPILPLYEEDTKVPATVQGLAEFVEGFVSFKGIDHASIVGNSLGGHVGLVYTLGNPEKVRSLILTGSSGLFESGMGSGFPRRGSYEYVKERVGYTFYSPEVATKELVDDVFSIVNDNFKTLRVLKMARSAQRHNMANDIHDIKVPTLLIWGLNDNITPPRVAHEFDKLIPKTELRFIDQCGHAPMMERPEEFNRLMSDFLKRHIQVLVQ